MELMMRHSLEDYAKSIRGLYPPGQWWDEQFSNPGSDLSRYVGALAACVFRTQKRIEDLLEEAFPDRAVELIGEYEQMLELEPQGTLEDRRRTVIEAWLGTTFGRLPRKRVGTAFGFRVRAEPQKGFCCRMSRLGERLWGVASRNYLVFIVSIPKETNTARKAEFEASARKLASVNYYLDFIYREE